MKKTLPYGDLPVQITEATAQHLDELKKSNPDIHFKRKTTTAEVKDVEQRDRTDTSVITSLALDRDCEIVDFAGLDLGDYRENSVVLYDHNQADPCGKCLWIKVDGDKLIAKTYYPPCPEGYEGEWLPDKVFALVQAGLCLGKSVGFIALEYRDPTDEELKRYPDCERVISKSLLLEYSAVTIPANPEALVMAVNKGLIKMEKIGTTKKNVKPVKAAVKAAKPNKPQVITLDIDAIVKRVEQNLRGKV